MGNTNLLNSVSYNLSSIAHCRLGVEWNYQNIISSFSRLYLITEGKAFVQIGKKSLELKKGYLYLIPSYIQCSYKCSDYMEQYYATFNINLPNNLNFYQFFNVKNEIKSTPYHLDLFKQLNGINQCMSLPSGDPKIYQKRLKLGVNSVQEYNANDVLRINGIISMFLAEFIESPKINIDSETHNRISISIKYIHSHLSEEISISLLAKLSCLSADHYTRKFKELTSQTPINYINQQRIENALHFLNTSSLSISEIAFKCGFSSNTYFSKVFKKYVNQTPKEYKLNIFH